MLSFKNLKVGLHIPHQPIAYRIHVCTVLHGLWQWSSGVQYNPYIPIRPKVPGSTPCK